MTNEEITMTTFTCISAYCDKKRLPIGVRDGFAEEGLDKLHAVVDLLKEERNTKATLRNLVTQLKKRKVAEG